MVEQRPPTQNEMIRNHMIERANNSREYMKTMQPIPMDNRERSDKEQSAIWDTLNGLPKDLRQNIMGQMAFRAGHKDSESTACEMCQFIAKNTAT